MATYFARKSGNVNAADVWATTPTGTAADVFSTFTADDILVANSFTVTLNVNTTVAQIRNDNIGGATAGGSFAMSVGGVTLTANILCGSANATCCSISGAASVTIVGSITGGSATSATAGLSHAGTGSVSVTGAVFGGTGSLAYGISHTGAGSLAVTGNITAGTGNASFNASAMYHGPAAGPLTITGNLVGNQNQSAGLWNDGPGAVIVTGNCTGGSGSSSAGLVSASAGGVASVVGTAIGSVGTGISVSSGTVSVVRAKGGSLASSAVGVSCGASGVASVDEIEYGDAGASPTSGPIRLANKTSNVCIVVRPNGTKKTLVDAASTSLLPAASNVRSGVSYNAGQTTGTMAVPPAGSVALGVPVDNTTGTAFLTAADLWAYLTASATTAGSMGERLKNAATVASTGQALADALTP